jgi:tRNA threonylcarbamoyl adenosine modification protein YeaZ
MLTLYIDTHANFIELILYRNGSVLDRELKKDIMLQSSIIMPSLNELFRRNKIDVHDLSDIIVVNGPGSFTGIRLGVTIAKTLAYTLQIPIRVMSSLLIKAISNKEDGYHWFVEEEKNGYYFGKYNKIDELINDYVYVKRADYESFCQERDVIVDVDLDYEKIYQFSRKLNPVNPHLVKPLYVKLIEVQK